MRDFSHNYVPFILLFWLWAIACHSSLSHTLLFIRLSSFTIDFMDDTIIGGPEPLVASDVKHINTNGGNFGLT